MLDLTWLPALMTAGVSSGLTSLISSGSAPPIPIQAGSMQHAWMSALCSSQHGSGVLVSGMQDGDAVAACWEQHGHTELSCLEAAQVSVLAWLGLTK